MKLTIVKTGINGEGIGYFEKKPVFVPGALADEEVLVDNIQNYPSYKTAELKRVLTPSSDRVEASCPYYEKCGGCSLLHASYERQLLIKKEILQEALEKYAGISWDGEVLANPLEIRYRNSLKMPVQERNGKLVCGLYSPSSNLFIRTDSCLLHEESIEKIRREVMNVLNDHHLHAYDRKSRKGLRYLHIRSFKKKTQVCLITGEEKIPEDVITDLLKIEGLVSLWQSENTGRGKEIFGKKMVFLGGNKTLNFRVKDLRMKLSPRSFYQMNTKQAERLYDLVLSKLGEEDLVVEAYSGIGVMSLLAAKKAKKVEGIEIVADAVRNGNASAYHNGIENCEFIEGDSAEVLLKRYHKKKISTLIVDPPRSGLQEDMCEAIRRSDIGRIIYVSCNPSTLAKDLSLLKGRYEVEDIEAIDLFSQTAHVETVVTLFRSALR